MFLQGAAVAVADAMWIGQIRKNKHTTFRALALLFFFFVHLLWAVIGFFRNILTKHRNSQLNSMNSPSNIQHSPKYIYIDDKDTNSRWAMRIHILPGKNPTDESQMYASPYRTNKTMHWNGKVVLNDTDNLLLKMRALLVISFFIIFVCIVVSRYKFCMCSVRLFPRFSTFVAVWICKFFEMENFLPHRLPTQPPSLPPGLLARPLPFLPFNPVGFVRSVQYRKYTPKYGSILSHSKHYNWWYLLNSRPKKYLHLPLVEVITKELQQNWKLKKLVHASCVLCFAFLCPLIWLTSTDSLLYESGAEKNATTMYKTIGMRTNRICILFHFILLRALS